MIRVAEIRPGNYVQDRLSWIKVETINRNVKKDYAVDPIPLTHEILMDKCGFVTNEGEYWSPFDESSGYVIEVTPDRLFSRFDPDFGTIFLTNLHDLQNDYKDCTGKDLEVQP
jgi:hypothetical protein